ncbi:hypothetical protein [Paramicrobacterium agarici]|uniref:hypothetical protein n=1 Tax=Paramicrobacterium agarici TaxID=630514 RepID=UPI0011530F19|nr:hypothetical protein [Microbacterium agarici]TQO24265.1 hypothetical protein FB385_3145 [Microbacterium agarici]
MARDNEATSPTELGHLVTYCQNASIDCLRSLRELVTPEPERHVRLPQVAAYPLIRAVIESSSQAIWMMMPEEGVERVARASRARWSEVVSEYELSQIMNRDEPEDNAERLKANARALQRAGSVRKAWGRDLREICHRAGLDRDIYLRGLPSWRSLIEEVAPEAELPARYVRAIWQMISGLSHPSSVRGVAFSKMREQEGSTDELRKVFMSADPQTVAGSLAVAAALFREAEGLYRRRSLTPAG